MNEYLSLKPGAVTTGLKNNQIEKLISDEKAHASKQKRKSLLIKSYRENILNIHEYMNKKLETTNDIKLARDSLKDVETEKNKDEQDIKKIWH